jgi:hypothetical protein
MQPLDWLIMVVYLAAVLGVAWSSTTRGDTRETSAGYSLAGRPLAPGPRRRRDTVSRPPPHPQPAVVHIA